MASWGCAAMQEVSSGILQMMTSEPTCGGRGGGEQGEQREPRSMDQKVRLALGEMLPLGRLFSWGVLPRAPVGAQGREL